MKANPTKFQAICIGKRAHDDFVCRSKSPTGLMLHVVQYSTQNKISMSMDMSVSFKLLTEHHFLNKMANS